MPQVCGFFIKNCPFQTKLLKIISYKPHYEMNNLGLSKEAEDYWIKENLDEFATELSQVLYNKIEELNLIKSGDLQSEFESTQVYNITNVNGRWVLQFKFPNYGRFIEINYFKKRKENKELAFQRTSRDLIWGSAKTKNKRGKNTRWYTKAVYGKLNFLIANVSYGMTQETVERLKKHYPDSQ